jgi:acetyl esterase
MPPEGVAVAGTPIVWVHGGAFMWGDLELPESDAVARALAAEGFPVITVAYRLARFPPFRPVARGSRGLTGVTYPVPVDDVTAVVAAVAAEFPGGILLGGASAGATLAAGSTLRLAGTSAGDSIRGAFFVYGLFHANFPAVSRELRARLVGRRKYTHVPRTISLTNLNYAGSRAAMREPGAFPGGHRLEGFPPALLIDADRDSMRASGSLFARELADARVSVDYHVAAEAQHAFLNHPGSIGWSETVDRIVAWAREPRNPAT